MESCLQIRLKAKIFALGEEYSCRRKAVVAYSEVSTLGLTACVFIEKAIIGTKLTIKQMKINESELPSNLFQSKEFNVKSNIENPLYCTRSRHSLSH